VEPGGRGGQGQGGRVPPAFTAHPPPLVFVATHCWQPQPKAAVTQRASGGQVAAGGPGRNPSPPSPPHPHPPPSRLQVAGIIKRNSWRERGFCGAIDPPKRLPPPGRTASVLVVPVDRRYPKIRIHTTQVRPWGHRATRRAGWLGRCLNAGRGCGGGGGQQCAVSTAGEPHPKRAPMLPGAPRPTRPPRRRPRWRTSAC
jgi:hypothetical protein